MGYTSIKKQAAIFMIIIMIVPILLVGMTGIAYFRNEMKHSIWNGNFEQAKVICAFTTNYLDTALLYLESQATRRSVYNAVIDQDTAFLNDTLEHIQNATIFHGVYITDVSGTVISSYPENLAGRNESDKQWVGEVLKTDSGYVGDGIISPVTGKPTVYISAPVRYNNTTAGVMVGALDLYNYAEFVQSSRTTSSEYVYIVNRTGHVMLHSNKAYMDTMLNVSDRAGVQNVLKGQEGSTEQYSPQDKTDKLVSYSPVSPYGWGVVISIPVDVAYQPITNVTYWFLGILALAILAIAAVAWLMSDSIVQPILRMKAATAEIPYGNYRKNLPEDRKDEIGDLARAFQEMAEKIRDREQKIMIARNTSEAERGRAELYVDIMGHDINNLNQAGLFSLEMMENDSNLTEEQRDLVKSAVRSFEGSAGIVENVRKIQKIDSEKLYLEKMDLDEIINVCIRDYPRPVDKKVTINYRDSRGMLVKGTPLLKEVFCNLLGNSMKYSGPEVTIDICARETMVRDKKGYEIEVSDNGYGIPDEMKTRLFRRFERGKTKAYGKGLGLYIVKMLIEHFGGTVEIADRVPGDYTRGVKFTIRLPAA